MSAAKTAREQTARSIAADAEGMRRPPIGRLTSKSVTAHRKRLAKIRRIAETRAAAAQKGTRR